MEDIMLMLINTYMLLDYPSAFRMHANLNWENGRADQSTLKI